MEILYVSRLCSEKRFAAWLRDQPVKPPQQEQKFHGLLARGLASHSRGVSALSVPPHHPGSMGFPTAAVESERGITFHYLSLRMIPGLSHAMVFAWSFVSCLRWSILKRASPRFVVCDVLDLSISAGALLASKLAGVVSIAIVTDIPNYLHEYIGGGDSAFGIAVVRAYRALSTFFMGRYDGYILLTEAMNALVNPLGRPHLVMEGMVDPDMEQVDNTLDGKFPERVILYAGALYEKYGVASLLDAFLQVSREDARLWLYGSGELDQKIREYETRDTRIKYWGVRPNAEVVAAEVRATLLVNPRPSHEAFTRFSFPSKNMEYMASGTPILTTPLPGMPAEYLDHVYTFQDESVEGMAGMLSLLLARPREELHLRGQGAKMFVLTRKSNLIQAGRIHGFLESIGRTP
ncbi:MAG TPA: glycosyltransferase [Geothrix sp.]|jgi:glycosyltransferase involved in cell wall biosynthesis